MTLAVAIPTYKRPHLLRLLVEDVLKQSLLPDYILVVDGDPQSGDVRRELSQVSAAVPLTYIPSNHGNLAYQRYLGWKASRDTGASLLIYFDDDERLIQADVLDWLVRPFAEANVVGVGCVIRFGERSDGSDAATARQRGRRSRLAELFGSGRNISPGGLTPTGHRSPPLSDVEDYRTVKWLRGGVMAYRMAALSESTFSDDLFALDHVHCGLGEDTFLSRRVGARGKLLYTFRAVVDHPNADTPKSYPFEASKYAYAAAYSRRLQNDYYRVYEPPRLADRWALVKSYAGTTLLAWMRTITSPSKLHFALARGTTLGAIHGLTRPPTAKRLTPDIHWRADAEAALKNAQVTYDVPRPQ